MKIAPRYDGAPLVVIDGPSDAIAVPLVRQRRRFADVVSELSREQWNWPTRCADWRVHDVIAHVASAGRFATMMIEAGVAETPSRFLAQFDAKATPAPMVESARGATRDETMLKLRRSTNALCGTIESLGFALQAGSTGVGTLAVDVTRRKLGSW